ncbi:MFS transporter [Calothrix sp. PCC 6303]|uniref:MFS transporter n=1 Tax=Calothrix sp. PCC 6303 TaxID=1170562 RepID=UPI0002A033F9|nr:MFS transporter [Calothrix sp. PCC 6303]AFZ03450.1 major facilitator superfamily MFS_1 [Calothrix sp. PCC 6303]
MSAFNDIDPRLRQNLLTLFTAGLFFWSSMASLLPTLPLYVEDIGASKQQIGVVMGSFAIGLLLCRPQLGQLADKRSRKLVLIIGALVAAIAPLGYAVVKSIPLLMALRAFHGISLAAFTTGYSTLVTDLAPSEKRGEIVGYMSLVNPIGMAIGPALGGYLQSEYGYLPLFLFSTISALLCLTCVYQVFCPVVAKKTYATGEDISLWKILLSPRIRIPTLVMFLVGLAFGTLSTFVPLFIKSIKIDLNAGLFYSTAAITSFSSRLVMGRISDRIGRGLFVTIGIVCYSISMFLLWQADSKASFLLAALIEGVGGGLMIPSIVTMMADRSQPQERGRVFALCVGGFDVGIAIAGPILGSVAEKLGYRDMFGFASFLTFVAIFIFMTQSSKSIRTSFNFALGRGKDVYAITE